MTTKDQDNIAKLVLEMYGSGDNDKQSMIKKALNIFNQNIKGERFGWWGLGVVMKDLNIIHSKNDDYIASVKMEIYSPCELRNKGGEMVGKVPGENRTRGLVLGEVVDTILKKIFDKGSGVDGGGWNPDIKNVEYVGQLGQEGETNAYLTGVEFDYIITFY